ncbi:MAG TPA: hypothetical protein VMD02_00705 [Candidatus Omnitrophota bacterium]|nr:hypothetical protein [Candidatus Omnitrophota bacterium]
MKRKLFALLLLVATGAVCVYADEYPKINVSGFKKWSYREAKVDPQTNYYLGLTQLGGFTPTTTGSPWEERLQLNILGQLTDKLSVSYDIEQQPESPDKYDVKVDYDNKHELAFGDLTATFSGNEFASATKYLNGVMITSHDTNYDILAVPSAKLKSQVQNITTQNGNNSKGPYSLGHGSIVEGSERIELNGRLQQRGRDYVIDYYGGTVTFNAILTSSDQFTYSYEYTNILDMFFPSLSKKDFFGVQSRFTFDPSTIGKSSPVPQQMIISTVETFPTNYHPIAVVPAFTGTAETHPTFEAKAATNEAGRSATRESAAAATNEARSATPAAVPSVRPSTEASAPSSREVTPLTPAMEDVIANESVGKYQLKNGQIVPFSEKLMFRGVLLKKNEDYTIKYDDGSITLLLPELPNSREALQVTYSYPKMNDEQEVIPGSGSRGPYNLAFNKLIQFSERIYLNDRLLVRDFDYIIDYDSGKLVFNYNVSNTSVIKANYRHIVLALPPPPPPTKFPTSLTIGATYMRESAQKGDNTATGDNVETRSYQDIASNNNTIYLANFPVVSTLEGGNLSVKDGDRTLVEGVDYAFPTTSVDPATGYAVVTPPARLAFINDRTDVSNGRYTGTIKVLTSLEATAEVSILYTYNKAIAGRFTGVGDGSRGPYYVKNYRNIVPGSESIQVWSTGSSLITTYVRNSSFEANAGDTGYSISYDKDMPYIKFNKELLTSQNFSIYFQYVVSSSSNGSEINQDVTGFDGAFKFGDLLQFDGAFARSSNDRVVSAVSTSESYTNFSPPTTRIAKLQNVPLIENSETVYVNGNLRNRDADYSIDYTSGMINFFYVTLTTKDVVTVDYQYQSTSQGVSQSVAANIGSAYKYGVRSSLGGVLDVSYSRKQIGFDFAPLGGTAIGVGSDYKNFAVNFTPKIMDLAFGHQYAETINPLSNSRTAFTKNYDRHYTVSANPYQLLHVSADIRNLETRGDASSAGGPPTADSSQNSYSLSVVPATFSKGPLSFSQQYDGSRSQADDNLSLASSRNEYLHAANSLGFTDRIKLSTDYQYSEPKSYTRGTVETVTALSRSRDTSYNLSLDFTFGRIQKWTAYANLINHEAATIVPTPEALTLTRNTTYHTDFNPVPMLQTSADYNRQETPSVTVLGQNPRSERTATNVRLQPWSYFSSAWAYSENLTVNESTLPSSGRSNTYTANWTMLSLDKVKLNSDYNYYYNTATSPSGTIEVKNDTDSFVQDYGMTITPVPAVSITPGFSQENYRNRTTSSTIELSTVNQTAKCHVDFTPISKFSMAMDYSNKITASLTDNLNRPKTNITVRSSYRLFDWGEIVHTFDEELNRGEVQAGGTMPDTDYKKSTNTYSLNFSIPQDNPILSSVVLTATAKYVRFENYLPDQANQNLNGSLWTFEGTLNF